MTDKETLEASRKESVRHYVIRQLDTHAARVVVVDNESVTLVIAARRYRVTFNVEEIERDGTKL